MFLEIRDVTVAYGALDVLKGVSLGVEKGELVALLGSSGCGKTTLLRSVSGFGKVKSGSIVVNGRDITVLPPERRNTAMVFQSYALWPNMTVAQNMAFGLKLRKVDKTSIDAKLAELMRLLKLEGLEDRNVTRLSGGQRQRVALGRALAVDPTILLLDEPLSNLDAAIRLELRHEIREIQKRVGITAMHVTHDREEAMVMADKIVVLNKGEIAQIGTPHQIYHEPSSRFVANFMGADNGVAITVQRVGETFELALGRDQRLTVSVSALPHVTVKQGQSRPLTAYFRAVSAMLLEPDEKPEDNMLMLPSTVSAVSYLGTIWRHFVNSDLGGRIVIDSARRFETGSSVKVGIPVSQIYVFSEA